MKLYSFNIAIVAVLLFVTSSLGDDCAPTTTCAPPTTQCPSVVNPANPNPQNGPAQILTNYNECEDLPSGTILVDKVHCRRYYQCENGRTQRLRCSLGDWFDKNSLRCLPRAQVVCAANRN